MSAISLQREQGFKDAMITAELTDDMAVIGFDDIFAASIRPVNLTTIKLDIEGIAESAILRLINKMSSETDIKDRKYVTAPCQLIIRGSCGSILKTKKD
jgi:LacI family transcriptional regulator, galactose operon repressor